jgi:ACDE family multidrug resistance protein
MPKAVLATAFATMVAFMGIGVVDPILPVIGRAMGATPAQVEMLFTSYIAVMSLAMLVAGALATRWGGRKTLLAGLGLVVVFATLSGLSNGIPALALVRGGWGLGNALFTSTALSIIVAASAGTVSEAITLYEAALGIGIASGPLLGGLLGTIGWRVPFFGTAALMAVAFAATLRSVPEPERREARRGLGDVVRALRHPDVLINALVGLGYSYGFFTVLAFSPLALGLTALPLGVTYFGWGLLVAVTSVYLVNVLRPRFGATRVLLADLALLVALFVAIVLVPGRLGVLVLIVVSGAFCGIANALFTTLAIEVSPFSRSISSGAYNFLRWAGAALAPVLSGLIAQAAGVRMPFAVAALILAVAAAVLALRRKRLEEALRAFARREAGGSAPDGLHRNRISAPPARAGESPAPQTPGR